MITKKIPKNNSNRNVVGNEQWSNKMLETKTKINSKEEERRREWERREKDYQRTTRFGRLHGHKEDNTSESSRWTSKCQMKKLLSRSTERKKGEKPGKCLQKKYLYIPTKYQGNTLKELNSRWKINKQPNPKNANLKTIVNEINKVNFEMLQGGGPI